MRMIGSGLALLCAALAACVTINVYFPAAAAEKAADRIIDDVWGGAMPGQTPATPGEPTSARPAPPLAIALLEALVPAVHAAEPDIDLSSPEITRLKNQMERRFPELRPHFDSGVVGLSADGYVAVRDPSAVPLSARNSVRTLVANENADRAALYREIAVANNRPDWEAQIREVFAARWIARAQRGWWYQSGGNWLQK